MIIQKKFSVFTYFDNVKLLHKYSTVIRISDKLFDVLQLKQFVEKNVELCQPRQVHICDGSEAENDKLLRLMQSQGTVKPLPKYKNWYVMTK